MLSTAQDLRRAGRFTAARAALADDPTCDAAIERARCAIILGSVDDARVDLEAVMGTGTAEEQALARAMAACAGGIVPNLLDIASAGSHIDDAVYYTAFAHYKCGRYGAVRSVLECHAPRTAVQIGRYEILRGAAFAAEDDFVAQAECARRALDALLRAEPAEPYQTAFAAMIVATLSRELGDLPEADDLLRVERQIAWTPELNTYRFQLFRTLGWRASTMQRTAQALRYFAKAGFYASTMPLRAFAHLDRVEAATAANELHSAESERTMAIECLESIDWPSINDESIAVLATAARVLAGVYNAEAIEYASLAKKLVSQLDSRWSFAHDARFEALINEGLSFARATGEPAAAVDAGVSAFEVFDRIGYTVRALRLARHLHALTGKDIWAGRATALAGRMNGGRRDVGAESLTPRQAAIANYLPTTMSFKDIGERLGISTSTVKTIAQRLYRRYGVSDRDALRRLMRAS